MSDWVTIWKTIQTIGYMTKSTVNIKMKFADISKKALDEYNGYPKLPEISHRGDYAYCPNCNSRLGYSYGGEYFFCNKCNKNFRP